MRGQRRRRGTGRSLSSSMAVNTQNSDSASFECITRPYSQSERRGQRYKRHARKMRKDNGQIRVYGWEEKGVSQSGRLQRPQKTEQDVETELKPLPALNTLGKIRLRNFRFSNAENMVLISKLVAVYEQLLGKRKPRLPLFRRNQMWEEICDAVNRVGKRQRFVHHCKKRFSDIKRQLRNKLKQEKRNVCNRNGLFAVNVFYTQYEEKLKKVLPAEVIDGIEFFDSDQPQDPLMDGDAGPLCSRHNNKESLSTRNPSSESELQYNSGSGPVQAPLNLGDLLEEQWHMLPDLCPRYTVESRTSSPGPIDPKSGFENSRRSRGQRLPNHLPKPAPTLSVQPPSKQLKSLKATQWLFRKGIIHSLNVLHLDINQLTEGITKNHLVAKKMLKAASQRNHILRQMNDTIGAVAESIQLLVNQQQAERILLSDCQGLQRPRWKQQASSLRSSSVTTATAASARQSREVHHSFCISSSSLVCLSDPGFLPDTNDTVVN